MKISNDRTRSPLAATKRVPASVGLGDLPVALLEHIARQVGSPPWVANMAASCQTLRQALRRPAGIYAQRQLAARLVGGAPQALRPTALTAPQATTLASMPRVALHHYGLGAPELSHFLIVLAREDACCECLDIAFAQLDELGCAELTDPDCSFNLALEALGVMPRLRQLRLVACGLRALPVGLSALRHLTILELGHNQLTALPSWLHQRLDVLEQLDLRYNSLERIAADIERLTALERLDLAGNPLQPECVTDITAATPAPAPADCLAAEIHCYGHSNPEFETNGRREVDG